MMLTAPFQYSNNRIAAACLRGNCAGLMHHFHNMRLSVSSLLMK